MTRAKHPMTPAHEQANRELARHFARLSRSALAAWVELWQGHIFHAELN